MKEKNIQKFYEQNKDLTTIIDMGNQLSINGGVALYFIIYFYFEYRKKKQEFTSNDLANFNKILISISTICLNQLIDQLSSSLFMNINSKDKQLFFLKSNMKYLKNLFLFATLSVSSLIYFDI